MTGVLAVTAGTAALPGIAVSGDPNTGIYSPGADQIGIATGGTARITIDASGRLLVGTSTTSAECRAIFQGTPSTPTANAEVYLQTGAAVTSVVSGTNLGVLSFAASDSRGAFILGTGDGTWTSSSFPTRLVFSTTADLASSPTERMRIGSNGWIETFSSTADAFVARSSSAAGTANYIIRGTHSATSVLDGTVSFQVSTNGNVTNTGNSYGAISDLKLKENIVDANSQWDDLKALQVRKYNFKQETGHEAHTQIGLVAQEVELVSPGLVFESPDRDEEGNDLGTVTKGVNYSVLYMKAVKALQEAMERIEALEADVAALKGA
jgi:hypothetical protein